MNTDTLYHIVQRIVDRVGLSTIESSSQLTEVLKGRLTDEGLICYVALLPSHNRLGFIRILDADDNPYEAQFDRLGTVRSVVEL